MRAAIVDELVHPDDHPFTAFDLALKSIGALADLLLREKLLDRPDDAAHLVDPAKIVHRLFLHLVGEVFHVVAAGKRVHHAVHARFEGDDLLRP